MFLFKKIVAPLLFPVPLLLLLLTAGLVALWFTRRQRAGRILMTAGTLAAWLMSYDCVTNRLLAPIEQQYPPLPGAPEDAGTAIEWVVVLGGGHTADPRLPPLSQLTESSVIRLVEGLRLCQAVPGRRLLLSGGRAFDPRSDAEIMAEVVLYLGFDEARLTLESESRDTEEQARLVAELVGEDPFILVTSASHMPRSMALFRARGLAPSAAPTGHWVKQSQAWSPGRLYPGAEGIRKAERAAYERIGLLWARVRGAG